MAQPKTLVNTTSTLHPIERTVLITGGSKGIGFATAKRCLAEGCRVILIARGYEGLANAREKLVELGHDADRIAIQTADLEHPEASSEWISQLPWLEEGLWGLVANAAVETLRKVTEFTLDDIMRMVKVNIVSPVLQIQACYPHLLKAKGNIVYVGSIADFKREATYSVYAGTKAFMKSFVGHAGQEFGFDGVRINVVSPGATETELMIQMRDIEKVWSEEHIRKFLSSVPMEQRNAAPAEIADAIWFALAGPRYFHGEDLRIYGGHP